jgi:hypothetical protein
MSHLMQVAAVGIGATVCMDIWALLLRRIAGVPSLDYCLLGRWVLHMRHGIVVHDSIGAAPKQPHECKAGWAAHYSIGVVFAFIFTALVPDGWLDQPRVLPALLFGLITVVVPFFTLQPALGLGSASSKTTHPGAARINTAATHSIFGAGLYLCAWLLNHLA